MEETKRRVDSYWYLNSTLRNFQVQVNFFDPSAVSSDLAQPDNLNVTVLDPSLFTDRATGLPIELDSDNLLQKPIPIVKQYTKEQYDRLIQQSSNAKQIGIVASLWELALIIGLKQAIFAVWILILVLQFLVYIAIWQIRFPPSTNLLLFELRRIVLGEFMEDLSLGDSLSESLGLKT